MKNLYCPQFLFGYHRGHSLIAGSERLSPKTEAFLSRHSDAVPGISLGDTKQYWSGLPVNSETYALIATWPAPEMPRPGCVWSHVILLDKQVLTGVENLGSLRVAFQKPVGLKSFSEYCESAVLHAASQKTLARVSRNAMIETLRAVYDPDANGCARYRHSDRVEATFEIWSQQWPALRHAFKFNTALQNRATIETGVRDWLRFAIPNNSASEDQAVPGWIAELFRGIDRESPLSLLLQRAGPDLSPEPSTVRLLARLFAFTNGLEIDYDLRALKFAARELPSVEDGTHLKDWLISEVLKPNNTRHPPCQ